MAGDAAWARDVAIVGTQMPGFVRIALTFDQVTKIQARLTNSVLVIGFAQPARVKQERLSAELPATVSAVRRDPDDTGLRIALAGPLRPSILEAGERIFLDLLPQNWSGLPPGLPADVVAQLAERALAAEAKLARQQQDRPRPEPPKPVRLRSASLPALTRFVFEPPAGTPMTFSTGGDGVDLAFDGPTAVDLAGEKPKLASGVRTFAVSPGPGSVGIKVAAMPGFELRAFQEDGTIVVDLTRPAAPTATPHEDEEHRADHAEPAKPAHVTVPEPSGGHIQPNAALSKSDETPPTAAMAATRPVPRAATASEVRPRAGDVRRVGAGNVVAVAGQEGGASSLSFPFLAPTPAAAFERDGRVTLVFDTDSRIVLPTTDLPGFGRPENLGTEKGISVIRLDVLDRQPLRFSSDETGWTLVVGGRDALPPDPVKVVRSADIPLAGTVKLELREPAAVHWLTDEGGERLAVVTATGRPQGMPKAMNFVEFALPATLQGIVVRSRSDDLSVALSDAGVTLSRERGLSLSSPGESASVNGAKAAPGVVLPRAAWQQDQSGDVFSRVNELVAVAAGAPRSGRADARSREARLLLANGLNEEAAGILALARADDPVFARRRDASILAGIANARAGRLNQAAILLNAEGLADDPEAILWRAVVDAGQRRWTVALKSIARSSEVLDQYGDEVAGPIRLAALQAALETGDLPRAEAELGALDRLPPEAVDHGEHEFARARFDEASGRVDVARKSYDALIADAGRPVWAKATLRTIRLGLQAGTISSEEAIARLEALSVAWRGDEVELGAMADLSALYAQANRWRDAFTVTQLAARQFPNDEVSRKLQDETARRFESVMMAGPDTALPPVDALALYFDFKEFAPAGRRGDEIVRRLADRLVELDLLDQAADLLQYQIDNRLGGAARAGVAARLAAIRLINGKPAAALAALHASRLANLPDDVRQFRLLLEAQALADLQRVDLALEVTDGEGAPEFARLRAGILWNARRWREAGEAFEALVGRRWQQAAAFSDRERGDVLRAAVAYGFAGEALAQGRLRSKFTAAMADSPDAAKFDMLLQPDAAETRGFRAVAIALTKTDALKALLGDWYATHPSPSGDGPAASRAAEKASAPPAAEHGPVPVTRTADAGHR